MNVSDSMPASASVVDHINMKEGGTKDAELYADMLAKLYVEHFVDPPLKGSPFYSREQFLTRLFEWFITSPNFKIVTLWTNQKQIVGFVYGCSLPTGSEWWDNLQNPLPKEFTQENGNRTLALLDIVVERRLRGQGLASRLHERLLQGRNEERVTLLSEKKLKPAYSIWQHWNYRKIGTTTVEKNEDPLDVFIRPLLVKSELTREMDIAMQDDPRTEQQSVELPIEEIDPVEIVRFQLRAEGNNGSPTRAE